MPHRDFMVRGTTLAGTRRDDAFRRVSTRFDAFRRAVPLFAAFLTTNTIFVSLLLCKCLSSRHMILSTSS
jgi:hypothetical protein